MVNIVPHKAFACSCAEGNEFSDNRINLRVAPPKHFGCGIFMERDPNSSIDEFSWSSICMTFNTSKLFFRTFNTSKLFFRTFNTSKLFFTVFKKCRVLKLQALAWKDKCTQGNNEYAYASGAINSVAHEEMPGSSVLKRFREELHMSSDTVHVLV
uniref:Uncharacterized protein n=1 Tax=Tanacetum cinerariifolium TaxID=118510 RepID=A0A699K1F3_TANCI|nr:hypothetical protein [Tanacetum cinerariifolium]